MKELGVISTGCASMVLIPAFVLIFMMASCSQITGYVSDGIGSVADYGESRQHTRQVDREWDGREAIEKMWSDAWVKVTQIEADTALSTSPVNRGFNLAETLLMMISMGAVALVALVGWAVFVRGRGR